jgi:hypothetical protein
MTAIVFPEVVGDGFQYFLIVNLSDYENEMHGVYSHMDPDGFDITIILDDLKCTDRPR